VTGSNKKTKWWVGAVISPFLFLGIGLLVALASPARQDDWMGMRFVIPVMGGLLLGCLLAFVFTAISIIKQEAGCFYALLVSVPALLFILYQVGGIVSRK
jgi:peptidoglycan/LPS O-acetylase OafA/YrhL